MAIPISEMRNRMQTHLFNAQRTGQSPFSIGGLDVPTVKGKCSLPQWPKYAPESNAVIDSNLNIYFGCHDGCFYSLDRGFQIRWSFFTTKKIYGSPLLVGDRVLFSSGDGNLYCLSLDGELIWRNQFSFGLEQSYFDRILGKALDVVSRKLIVATGGSYLKDVGVVNSWASANMDDLCRVYITGSGLGLWVYNLDDGSLVSSHDLGEPRHHLSGVTIAKDGVVFCSSQRRRTYCFVDLKQEWIYDFGKDYDVWASSSYDEVNQCLYIPYTKGNKAGAVVCLSRTGECLWRYEFSGGIRCTPVLGAGNELIFCSYDGVLFCLDRCRGKFKWSKRVSHAERAFWSSPCIDSKGNILLSVKHSASDGAILALDRYGQEIWTFQTQKVLSTPVLDASGVLYFGTWGGEYIALNT